jgi:hypothetical protein
MEPSEDVLEVIRKDEEFVLYRADRLYRAGSPSLLLLVAVAKRPPLETLRRIEHEYSLKDELDPAWAVQKRRRHTGASTGMGLATAMTKRVTRVPQGS